MRRRSYLFVFLVSFLFWGFPAVFFGQNNTTAEKKESSTVKPDQGGFYNVTSFIPVAFSGQILCGGQTICGYKVNEHLAIGGGIGYELFNAVPAYEDFTADLSLLPVFADIRYTVLKSRISPVIDVNAGYKVLLKNAMTQVRNYSTYSNVLGVLSRNDYTDYNTYRQGGPFITAGAGVRAKISRKVAVVLSLEYSLWSVTGDYHLSTREYLQGSEGWVLTDSTQTTDKSLAYVHMFFLRASVVF